MDREYLSLVRLEYKKHTVKIYVIASVIGTLFSLLLSIFFLFIPKFDITSYELNSIKFILMMNSTFIMGVYSFILAAMIIEYIIKPYSGYYLYKTLSYPVNRDKIFLSKIFSCVIFVISFCFISLILTDIILYFSNLLFKIVNNDFYSSFFIYEILVNIYIVIVVLGIAFGSLLICWRKKSTIRMMIGVFISYSIIGNQIQFNFIIFRLILILINIFIVFFTIFYLLNNIRRMEV
ncbi:hypothetical protein [Streptobacillus canis]|uniref:hypothetical protein n=1 Tax=Streptobacillus canis TaxID=2678686 RepID=UPI0012E21371|nr:hypothetical protein [Streptobacillus canis]